MQRSRDSRRVIVALLLSALVHLSALVAFALWPSAPKKNDERKAQPIQLVLMPVPKKKPLEEAKPVPEQKTAPKKLLAKKLLAKKDEAKKDEAKTVTSGDRTDDNAKHETSERQSGTSGERDGLALNDTPALRPGVGLFPTTLPNGVVVSEGPPSKMHLLHNDPSELPSKEALQAEEEIRVSQRVGGWMADDLATIKADNGGADPYVSNLRESLKKKAEHPPPFKSVGSIPAHLFNSYLSQAEQYAKSGNPYGPGTLANDPAHLAHQPDHAVGANGRTRDQDIADQMQAGAQLKKYADGGGNGVLAIVSISQDAEAKLVEVKLIAASGDSDFDKFVLSIAPEALTQLPPFAPGSHPRGLRTEWAFRGSISYRKHMRDMNLKDDGLYQALTLPINLLGGASFEETTGDMQLIDFRHPEYRCSVSLLKLYE